MAMNRVSDFMLTLSKNLVEQKKIAESSAALYVKNLWTLNGGAVFNNLSFLRNTEAIDNILATYADSTRKTFLASIVSVLSLYKDKPTYKKVYQHYYDKMMTASTASKATETNGEKTTKQKDNWVEWDEVLKAKTDLYNSVKSFVNQKLITPAQYNELLSLVVLSLYTDIPPRRNQDYADMFVVGKWNDKMDSTKNYLDLAGHQFVFNKYKTAKKYGTQIVDIKEAPMLTEAITMFLKHHPLHKGKITKNTEFKFLVYSDGSPLVAVNAITRILNKVFGKKVGSSMIRHIYLSSKYGDIKEEQQQDAEAMGHSVAEQQGVYVKK
jgi:hypothetical protein